MEPRIEILPQKHLIGKSLKMSLSNNKTFHLWSSFMPYKNTIENTVGSDLYSMQIYDALYFKNFNPNTEFTKWAAIEVTGFTNAPNELERYIVKGGLYTVFLHKGTPQEFPKTMQFILGDWLPKSEYAIDNREHFELLGEKYKNNDPGSEEEVWIPIKKL